VTCIFPTNSGPVGIDDTLQIRGFQNDRYSSQSPILLAEITVILKNSQIHVAPTTKEILIALGERIRFRRKLRMITETKLSNNAGVARSTLQGIEKGSPGVSIGAYIRVMYMLGMERDLLLLGIEDESDRILLDKSLKARSKMF